MGKRDLVLWACIGLGIFAGQAIRAAAPPAPPLPSEVDLVQGEPKVTHDITFATVNGVDLKLDLYQPANATAPSPLVVLIHGGGWGAGKRQDFGGDCKEFAQHGYAAATVEYRLSKVAPFPAQIQDVKAAIRWLRKHAADYNIDPDHIAAMGHSAGGHLAALVGTSGDIAQFDVGDNLDVSSKVQAVVDMAGPVDVWMYFSHGKATPPAGPIEFFGGTLTEKKDLVTLASPVSHISPETPPYLIVSGMADTAVGDVQPQLMAAALGKAGVPFQMMLVPGVPHGIDLNLPYGKGKLWDAIYFFLDPLMKKQGSATTPPVSP